MIEQNDEENLKNDLITTNDGQEFESTSSYILGAPFIQAFIVILEFENNRIGFANKIRNFGSKINLSSNIIDQIDNKEEIKNG